MYQLDPNVLDVLVRERRRELLSEARILRVAKQHRVRKRQRRRR